ncbi:hypothetical protein DFQ27_006960 [Actinomortierella ambigua]|uniref:Septin-type G domain-containing protein n=1 Tax=Actinomortierella ambigua TaxID=1343610 RepID=A0A9P6QJ07_9FUNG|nr:hypothetical protein DFQ27_006960 [Actinomortierella ambigua]
MMVGYSGLGKTSFIRTLFGTLQLRSPAGSKRATMALNPNGHAPQGSSSSSSDRPTTPLSRKSTNSGLNSQFNNNTNANHTNPNPADNHGLGTKTNAIKDSVGYATGKLEPTLNSYEALYEIDEGNERINLTLVDTPGFVGTDEVVDAHCDEILAYLEYQFDLTLAEERKVRRNPKASDNQIHACLYFIDHTATATSASHATRMGLSEADIRILKRLVTRVNVIPVIARADTLTKAQVVRLKQAIIRDAKKNKIKFFRFISAKDEKRLYRINHPEAGAEDEKLQMLETNEDEEEAEEKARNEKRRSDAKALGEVIPGVGEDDDDDDDDDDEDDFDEEDEELLEMLRERAALQAMVPFSVIAQEEEVQVLDEQGRAIQGREFPWGVINCWDAKHCDLAGLRSSLLQSHRAELKELTFGHFYESYRTEKLTARTSQRRAMQSQQQQQQQQQHQQQQQQKQHPNHITAKEVRTNGTAAHQTAPHVRLGGPWEE